METACIEHIGVLQASATVSLTGLDSRKNRS